MTIWIWIGFFAFIVLVLALDLGAFQRQVKPVATGEALAWTAFWIALSLAFSVAIYFIYQNDWLKNGGAPPRLTGMQASLQFFTGYIVAELLSLDNIFVFAVIFAHFRTPLKYQRRVLFWGILGALVMRGIMIAGGVYLLRRFAWIAYVFGFLLILTAVKLLIEKPDNVEPDRNVAVQLAKRFYPVVPDFEGERFFTLAGGKRAITPLFLILILVESADALFAVDSIPAILAISGDPFIIFAANIFALLGLRSLYFALAALLKKFAYLETSLVFLMTFIGVKMALLHLHPISIQMTLAVVLAILTVGVLASIFGPESAVPVASPFGDDIKRLAELTYKNVRRISVLVIGTSVLLVGIAMIVLPGPAVIVIPAGLAILATEFAWARTLLKKFKEKATSLTDNIHTKFKNPDR